MTSLGIWAFLDKNVYLRFHDVIVPTSNGTTQVDHILVSPFGIFVIETKNMKGWIFGSEQQAKWTQSLYGKKYSFQNPLRQNFRHMKCLSGYLRIDESRFHSVVFFIGECTFKTSMPENVLSRGLSTHIKSYHKILLSNQEIGRITEEIQSLKNNLSLTKREHLTSLKKRHTSTTTCPKCGSKLVERTARKGPNAGSSFLGCSAFPKCRYTQKV
jgi:hypothetical protein